MDSETKDSINWLKNTATGAAAILHAMANGLEIDESTREALRLVAISLERAAWKVEEQ